MNRLSAARLVSTFAFAAAVIVACSGSSKHIGAGDAGHGGGSDDATVTRTDGAGPEDGSPDEGLDSAGEGGTACAPGATQCSGNGVQPCGPSGQWGASMDCGA